jgi:hypothetical protein
MAVTLKEDAYDSSVYSEIVKGTAQLGAGVTSHTVSAQAPNRIGMGVLTKLIMARAEMQNIEIKKSGHNKFAGYSYFELADFLPVIQELFAKWGLVDVIQFDKEMATMTVYDIHDGSSVRFTSPMADAQLKGCHPIQNLGAVETYQRRYLYVTAMAIVEHDALESVTGSPQGAPQAPAKPAPAPAQFDKIDMGVFVDGLIELGRESTSLADLSNLWKMNQNQIDFVKKNNKSLFEKLQKEFAVYKAKFKE